MKKVIGVVVALLVMMSVSAFAADDACYECRETKGYTISLAYWNCPGEQESCGYVKPYFPAIIKVCDCDEAERFVNGAEVGLKFTSLTPGVYFKVQDFPSNLLMITDEQPYCDWSENDYTMAGTEKWEGWIYTQADGDEFFDLDASDYWTDCDIESKYKFVEVCTGVEADNADGFERAGYVISGNDDVFWQIDMPAMVVDWSEASDLAGTVAQVKVQITEVEGDDKGICTECEVLCECVIDVFTICAPETGSAPSYKMYFPYAFNNEAGWFSGIAISNLTDSVAIEDMEAMFTIYDVNGDEYTATKDDFTEQFAANTVEGWMAEFGVDVPDGPVVIWVQTNFMADGYQFNLSVDAATGMPIYGAGTLPVKVD